MLSERNPFKVFLLDEMEVGEYQQLFIQIQSTAFVLFPQKTKKGSLDFCPHVHKKSWLVLKKPARLRRDPWLTKVLV